MNGKSQKIQISCKGVHYTLVRKQETGRNEHRKRSETLKMATRQEDNFIRINSKRNRRLPLHNLLPLKYNIKEQNRG